MRKFLKSKDIKALENMHDISDIELEISNLEWELERCMDGGERLSIREKLEFLRARKEDIEKEAKREQNEMLPDNNPYKADEDEKNTDKTDPENSPEAEIVNAEARNEAEKNSSSRKGVLSRFSTKVGAIKKTNLKKVENLIMQISELEWKLEHETDENEKASYLAKLESKRQKLSKIMDNLGLSEDEELYTGLDKRIDRIEKYIEDPLSEEQDYGKD